MSETPVVRLRRLLLDFDPWTTDHMRPSPKAPLAPYGQHADDAAAFASFRHDLDEVFKALDALAGDDRYKARKPMNP